MQKRILLLAFIFSQQSLAINQNLSVNAELLYWTISEVGADNWGQVISKPAQNQSIELLDLNFKWRPGLRVGLNYLSDSKIWDTNLYYTWYQTRANQSVSSTTDEIHSAFSSNFYANNTLGDGLSGPFYHQAAIDWSFLYNNIDWEIGRYFNDSDYIVRPFIGLKTAFLNQGINTTWQTPFDNSTKLPINSFSKATENIQNNFWGVGPSFGLNTQWNILNSNQKNLGLFGDFSAAFLWGSWNISDNYQNDTPISIATVNNVRSSTITMTRGLIGINWQQNTPNIHIIFELAYEAQAWMNQLKFYSFDGGRQNGTLYIQGGVLNVRMHF